MYFNYTGGIASAVPPVRRPRPVQNSALISCDSLRLAARSLLPESRCACRRVLSHFRTTSSYWRRT